mmetsp:Transcript_1519/g.3209  ORF Transcript_1519/g.3209 Transcript_1519/m.3209 type:complete len:442 (-) Transcript_1519:168-1493(-)
MSCLACEQVVQQVVPNVQHSEGRHPAQFHGNKHLRHGGRQPAHHTQGVQLPAHANEDCKPHQRVPRSLLLERVVPAHHARTQQQHQPQHRGQHGGHTQLGAEHPQHNRHAEPRQHLLLRVLKPAHRLELLRGLDGRLRSVLHSGGVDQVDQVGGEQDGDDAGHAGRDGPLVEGIGEGHPEPLGKLDAQEVLRGGGEQDGGGVVAALQLLGDEERLRLFVQAVDDGHEHTSGARGGGRHRRADGALRCLQAVGERESGLAKDFDEEEGEAVAEARLNKRTREDARHHDEPDHLVGESAEGCGKVEVLGDDGERCGREGPRTNRHGLQHQANHGAQKDGQQVPCLHSESGWDWHKKLHCQTNSNGYRRRNQLDAVCFWLRGSLSGCCCCARYDAATKCCASCRERPGWCLDTGSCRIIDNHAIVRSRLGSSHGAQTVHSGHIA